LDWRAKVATDADCVGMHTLFRVHGWGGPWLRERLAKILTRATRIKSLRWRPELLLRGKF
jgi:hypothetical protein